MQKFTAKLTMRKYFIIRTSEEWLYKRFVRSSFHKNVRSHYLISTSH